MDRTKTYFCKEAILVVVNSVLSSTDISRQIPNPISIVTGPGLGLYVSLDDLLKGIADMCAFAHTPAPSSTRVSRGPGWSLSLFSLTSRFSL